MDSAIRTASATENRLRPVPVSTRQRRRVETLTSRLLMPLGAVTVLCGWQGIGKGTILARLAADETLAGRAVGIVSDEDSIEATIRPRLEAAGADLDLAFTFEPIDPADVGVLIPRDNAEIAEAAELRGMRLLIVDPWTNHVDVPDVDKGQVRRALMPFSAMCRSAGIAAILSAHPNRRDTDDPLMSIAHAGAVSQVARCVYHVTIDPEGGTLDRKQNTGRLLIHGKANMTRFGPTLRYQLEPRLLPAIDGQPEVDTVSADYVGESGIADYAQARQRIRRLERAESPKDSADYAEAAEWLRGFLADGAQPKARCIDAGQLAGEWSARTIERAKTHLGLELVRDDVTKPGWWRLPDSPLASANHAQARGETGETGETMEESGVTILPARVEEANLRLAASPVSPASPDSTLRRDDMDGGW